MQGDAQTRYDYLRRLTMLRSERSTWFAKWQDLAAYLQPWRGRFMNTDRNRGQRRDSAIINNTPLVAFRTLAAGMMSGITSPARLWFSLTLADSALADSDPIKEWLEMAEERVFKIFAQSNVYPALQVGYTDLGVFGTHVDVMEEDEKDIIRLYSPPIGRYYLACGPRLVPDTLFEETSLTVIQTVKQFGLANCSDAVKTLYKNHMYDNWVNIIRVIEPNETPDPESATYTGKAYKTCWFESGTPGNLMPGAGGSPSPDNKFLLEGGYGEFPVLAPRWGVTGADVYGSDQPGDYVLGDARALQQYERRGAEVVDKIVRPPMVASSANRNTRLTTQAGDISYTDGFTGQGRPFQPAFEVSPQALQAIREEKMELMRRVNTGAFADLFLMLANSVDHGMTAREVAERHEEKLIALGPVLERVNTEYLGPLVAYTLHAAIKRRLIPPPPPELRGQPYRVEPISILAQAQKLLGVTSNDRAWQFALQMAQAKPEVLDVIDADKLLMDQWDRLGVSPKTLKGEDQVKAERENRAKMQQQAQQQQQVAQASQAAKNLGQAQTTPDTALGSLANNLSPVAGAIASGA